MLDFQYFQVIVQGMAHEYPAVFYPNHFGLNIFEIIGVL